MIVERAASMLGEGGLAGLTMRRLARDLDVQPGALYHYVASKQELLAAVGEYILSDSASRISTTDPARAAADIRATLLPIRDGAEVISFVYAYKPETLGPLNNLQLAVSQLMPARYARTVTEAIIRYVLGFVAVEQNHAELVRAHILEPGQSSSDSEDVFALGIHALLAWPQGKSIRPRPRGRRRAQDGARQE